MTKEEIQLLFKDLCARLPYGVMYETPYGPRVLNDIFIYSNGPVYTDHGVGNYNEVFGIELENIKPYLRPMSGMTEEELKELNDKYGSIAYFFMQEPPYYHGLQAQHSDIGSIEISEFSEIYDWLNAHHFDYRGLIEKGLVLEAPERMYKI